MSPWKPIETCPKDGSYFDVWAKRKHPKERGFIGRIPDGYWDKHGECIRFLGMRESQRIRLFGKRENFATHWMPIPDGPEKGE